MATVISSFWVEVGFSLAEQFVRQFLLDDGVEPEAIGSGKSSAEFAALYEESASPQPAPPERFRFRHAQGAAAEVGIALAEALREIGEGCPPTEIAITARSLEPYAAAIEEAFEDAGLPWTSSLRSPLRRHPVVRDFMLLLRVAALDFPRRITVELLRSTRIRWDFLHPRRPAPSGHGAEVWSRKARLIGLSSYLDGKIDN